MDNAIKVGNTIDKSTTENINKIINTLFTSARENSMDQSTVVEAINMIGRITEVKNVTITNSTFTGDKIVNMDDSDKEL